MAQAIPTTEHDNTFIGSRVCAPKDKKHAQSIVAEIIAGKKTGLFSSTMTLPSNRLPRLAFDLISIRDGYFFAMRTQNGIVDLLCASIMHTTCVHCPQLFASTTLVRAVPTTFPITWRSMYRRPKKFAISNSSSMRTTRRSSHRPRRLQSTKIFNLSAGRFAKTACTILQRQCLLLGRTCQQERLPISMTRCRPMKLSKML